MNTRACGSPDVNVLTATGVAQDVVWMVVVMLFRSVAPQQDTADRAKTQKN
jgi:hypothetical protein